MGKCPRNTYKTSQRLLLLLAYPSLSNLQGAALVAVRILRADRGRRCLLADGYIHLQGAAPVAVRIQRM